MRRRRFLQQTPIYAVAGFIGFLFLSTLWNYAVERHYPKLRIRSAHPLAGVSKAPPTPVSVESFLSGEAQKAFSTNLGQSLPVFAISVRAKNQLLYSLFRVSGASNILVGREDQLFERIYVDEFCNRGGALDSGKLEGWANRILESQNALTSMGKGFVFLISPSKPAQYPQYLPADWSCPALSSDRTEKLSAFQNALDSFGVRYVGAPALLNSRKHEYSIDFFPRGGIHWNLLGAALASREVTRALEASPQGSALGALDFDWKRANEARGPDRDLLELLNLLWPDTHYPVAAIEQKGPADAARCERTPRLAAIGGSFLHEIIAVLAHAQCPPETDHWFYMRTADGSYDLVGFHLSPGEAPPGTRVSANEPDLRTSIERADIVLLEENESNIGSTPQVANLRQLVDRVHARQ